jgi:hypothetical protein
MGASRLGPPLLRITATVISDGGEKPQGQDRGSLQAATAVMALFRGASGASGGGGGWRSVIAPPCA